jgi:hypothetical protein
MTVTKDVKKFSWVTVLVNMEQISRCQPAKTVFHLVTVKTSNLMKCDNTFIFVMKTDAGHA